MSERLSESRRESFLALIDEPIRLAVAVESHPVIKGHRRLITRGALLAQCIITRSPLLSSPLLYTEKGKGRKNTVRIRHWQKDVQRAVVLHRLAHPRIVRPARRRPARRRKGRAWPRWPSSWKGRIFHTIRYESQKWLAAGDAQANFFPSLPSLPALPSLRETI